MAVLLVRVIPKGLNPYEEKKNREDDFFKKYGGNIVTHSKDRTKRDQLFETIKEDSNIDQTFEKKNLFYRLMQRCRQPSRYKLLEKSTKRIQKELDLVQFVKRMRLLISGTLGLLKPQQRLFADEFSQINIHESSFFDNSSGSDDGQGKIMDKAKDRAIKLLVRSKDERDQRFINMHRMR